MGCNASKSAISPINHGRPNSVERRSSLIHGKYLKKVSKEATLPNYWGSRTSIKISKEGRENIKKVAQELGI